MSEDVQERMLALQQNEMQQLVDLTGFLETELAFAAEYHSTLLSLQEDWPDMCVLLFFLLFGEPF